MRACGSQYRLLEMKAVTETPTTRRTSMSTLSKQFISTLGKVVASIGLLSLFSVMPLKAQVLGNGVKFTTTFPFYVGKAKMPAGTYMITQLGINESEIVEFREVTVGSHDPLHSAMILVMPTESSNPPRQ